MPQPPSEVGTLPVGIAALEALFFNLDFQNTRLAISLSLSCSVLHCLALRLAFGVVESLHLLLRRTANAQFSEAGSTWKLRCGFFPILTGEASCLYTARTLIEHSDGTF